MCSECTIYTTCSKCQAVSTENFQYIGPTLPCSNIQNKDSLTTVIQKLDEANCQNTPLVIQDDETPLPLQPALNFLNATVTNNTLNNSTDIEFSSGGISDAPSDSVYYSRRNGVWANVLNTVLTGISFVSSSAVVATDSILVAFGKLQKQINNIVSDNYYGTYTPVFTNVQNMSAPANVVAFYSVTGKVVNVRVSFSTTPTATGNLYCYLTPPIDIVTPNIFIIGQGQVTGYGTPNWYGAACDFDGAQRVVFHSVGTFLAQSTFITMNFSYLKA